MKNKILESFNNEGFHIVVKFIMGFDIDIFETKIVIEDEEKVVVLGDNISSAYLSYNWSDLSSICPEHLFLSKCECENHESLWYLRNDLHRRFGSDVADRAKLAIKKLADLGIGIPVPDIKNSCWGWGNNMSQLKRLEVFAFHLNEFRKLGEQYPEAAFIADADNGDEDYLYINNEETIKINVGLESDSASETETDFNSIVTYFRHPIKGNMRIDNFDTAIEVFGYLSAISSPMAYLWKDLAFQMHDAPSKT